jgi:YebC/PmpR family DNA-binding regulatory protein
MAGHSHWANIKHKKAAADYKKAKVITLMGRLIRGAISVGGPDPDANPRLRLAIQKAKAQNMTNDVIDRILARAKGDFGGKAMEELSYEGYAAGGVAVVVDCMTDNRNRTPPEIRKLFERGGGAMGAPGCVSWQFKERGVFVVSADEDRVLEVLLEAEVDVVDVAGSEGAARVLTEPNAFDAAKAALDGAGIEIVSSELTKLADNDSVIDDLETARSIQKFLDSLDEHDDVTAVYSNFVPGPSIADQF